MTYAITGATSMIGIATIKECIKQNINVLAFSRASSTKIDRIPKSNLVKVIECDLAQMSDYEPNGLTCDVFIHLGWAFTDKVGRNDVSKQLENVQFTIEAIKLAKRMDCKKFIGAGSQAEYGTPNTVLKADTPCNPLVPYGIAKYAAGKFSFIECVNQNMECVWVRILSVYGTNDLPGTLISQLIKNAKTNTPLDMSGCEQTWDYLFEDDAGRAFVAIAQKGMNGKVYNLGSGVSKKLKNFVTDLIDVINPDYKTNFGVYAYSDKQPFILTADISDLTRDTGWKPTVTFIDGIRKICENTSWGGVQ